MERPRSLPVSGLVITYNEETNLPACLDSMSFLDEVFVVDCYSQDGTSGVCERHADAGVRMLQHEFEDYSSQRNWALREVPWSNEWILAVDADERVTPELAAELELLFQEGEGPDCDAYMLRRRFYFLGRRIRHCGLYSCWLVRLFKRNKTHYERKINEQVVVDGRIGRLQNDLLHEDRKGVAAWIWKHNRYSSMEAESVSQERHMSLRHDLSRLGVEGLGALRDPLRRRILLKQGFRRLPCRYLFVFLYMYVVKLGFLDGMPGFYYCLLHAANQVHIAAKTYEKKVRKQGRKG